jgi:hypothetical protein
MLDAGVMDAVGNVVFGFVRWITVRAVIYGVKIHAGSQIQVVEANHVVYVELASREPLLYVRDASKRQKRAGTLYLFRNAFIVLMDIPVQLGISV